MTVSRIIEAGNKDRSGLADYIASLRRALETLHWQNWRKRQRIEGQIQRLEQKVPIED